MICRNCLRVASRTQSAYLHRQHQPATTRFLTTTPSSRLASTSASASATVSQPESPTSSSPSSSSSSSPSSSAPPAPKKASVFVKSSVPAGVPLRGLNFLKNAQDPIALPDDEYPDWLWTVLARQEKKDEQGTGDLFSKSKKQRRLAAKRLRKEQAMNPELLLPKVPLYEQTLDLPGGSGDGRSSLADAVVAADARAELTKAMRNKRRASIKEANFLKSMG